MKQRLDTPSAPRTTFVRFLSVCGGVYFSAGRREEALHRTFSALLILMLVHLAFHPGRNEKVDFVPFSLKGNCPKGKRRWPARAARQLPLIQSRGALFKFFIIVTQAVNACQMGCGGL